MFVAGLQFLGAHRNNGFQLCQVLGQGVFGAAPVFHFTGHGLELLIGSVHQYANFIVFVTAGAVHFRLPRICGLAIADLTNHSHQRLGQHDVKQAQKNKGEHDAANKTAEQCDFRPLQKPLAEGVGIHLKVQDPHALFGEVIEVQSLVK